MDNFQVVYSDETLKEIKRSVGYETKFLNILKELDAYHLKVMVEQPGFIITDKSTIANRDVFEAFNEFCSNDGEHGNIENAMNQWLFKFHQWGQVLRCASFPFLAHCIQSEKRPTTGTKSPLGRGSGTSLSSARPFGGKPNYWLTENPNEP